MTGGNCYGYESFVLLFVVATAVAIAASRLRIPYTVALVCAGLVLGVLHLFHPPELTKELLYALVLPGLLFEAAFHLEFRDFWRDRTAIAALAVPGVAAAVGLTAVILEPIVKTLGLGEGFGWSHAVIFGALIAATDPIAVVSLFKNLGAPRRLIVLLEGESLLNDGTAIVIFSLVLGIVSGGQVTAVGLVVEFARVVGGGLAIGVLIGLAISQIIRQVDDPMIEITLTTLAAYGSFLAGEHLGFSGVIATVAAGMLCGNYAARTGMSPSTRIAAETFWEYIAFALNSIVFLLVGLHVNMQELRATWLLVVGGLRGRDAGAGRGRLRRDGARAPESERPDAAVLGRGGDLGWHARQPVDGAGAGASADGAAGFADRGHLRRGPAVNTAPGPDHEAAVAPAVDRAPSPGAAAVRPTAGRDPRDAGGAG